MPKPNFPQKLLLASPRGFCAGVKRALDVLNEVIKKYPTQKIYCYHEIVHNTHVVKDFENRGVIFVNSLDEVPKGSVLVFSAHGVSPQMTKEALDKDLKFIDATCPYVLKTHQEVKKYASEGFRIIYLGRTGHDEAVGTTGEAPDKTILIESLEQAQNLEIPKGKVALVTQTTLSFDETENIRQTLKKKFPEILEPPKSDICMATQNRQNGVKEMVKNGAEIIVVLGSPNSSNSKNLRKTAQDLGAEAYLIDDVSEIAESMFLKKKCVGLTAGASLPENKMQEALEWFKKAGSFQIQEVVVADESQITFTPPQ
ncbi:MAG: 4-hydroxy-3-methylbut-2-enyl diphosphate reductase [Candidatus Daviesbacteria bacterium]